MINIRCLLKPKLLCLGIRRTNNGKKKLNVYSKLQQARVDLQKRTLKKSGQNSYSKFTYFELKDFLPAVNEIFLNVGLSSNFSIDNNIANLFIINTDNLEENVLFTSPIEKVVLKGCTPIQEIGAVHTYMKRYLYLNALEIVEDDVLDPEVGKPTQKEQKKPVKAETPKIKLFNKLKDTGLTNEEMQKFCEMHGISSQDESTIIKFFNEKDINKELIEFLKAS